MYVSFWSNSILNGKNEKILDPPEQIKELRLNEIMDVTNSQSNSKAK